MHRRLHPHLRVTAVAKKTQPPRRLPSPATERASDLSVSSQARTLTNIFASGLVPVAHHSTDSRNSTERSLRSRIEAEKRAIASAPSLPADVILRACSNGAAPSCASDDVLAALSLTAPSGADERHREHTIPPRETTKYTAPPSGSAAIPHRRHRENSRPKPVAASIFNSYACRNAAVASPRFKTESAFASTR